MLTLPELIDAAVIAKGGRKHVAEGLHQNPQRLTDWKAGSRKPDAHEIAYLAECAGLPVLQTVAEIESQLDSRYADLWRAALGKLTAAGVAASFVAALTLLPNDAEACNLHADECISMQKGSLYIMSTRIRK